MASDNTWGVPSDPGQYDSIGWGEGVVNYYQSNNQGNLPCWWAGPQEMFIACPAISTMVKYTKNEIRFEVGSDYVAATRQSTTATRAWP